MGRYLKLWAFVSFAVSAASSAFAADVSFTNYTSSGQATYLHADLNADGREDFVFTLGQTTGGFAVSLSTGDGVYAAPANYVLPYSESATTVLIGDFNRDGNADLLVFGAGSANQQSDVFLYLNDGKGSFSEKASWPVSDFVSSAVVGDFNHDGIMDVAFLTGLQLNLWFGDGNSSFRTGPTTTVDMGGALMMGDFDGDGNGDLAIADLVNYSSVQVLYGDSRGNFPAQTTITVPGGHSVFGTSDVNSDAKTDIVVSTFYPNNPSYVGVYYGDTARTFGSHTTIPVRYCASNFSAPVAADVNGDGINDLIVPESDCNDSGQATRYIGVLTRNPDSSYNADQTVYTSPSSSLILGWLSVMRGNADTKPDIAFWQCTATPCSIGANYQAHVLLNTTAGGMHTCPAPDAFTGINLCSPTGGSVSAGSVPFHIGAAGQAPMRKIEVWVDGVKRSEQDDGFSNYAFLDSTISLDSGAHQITVYAAGWDNSLQEKSFTLNAW